MRTLAGPAIVITALLLTPSLALAQPSSESRWTVTPFIGVIFGGDTADTDVSLGAAAAYNLTPRLSLEGEAAYSSEGTDDDHVDAEASLWTFSGNVVFHFTGHDRLLPYATAGFGMMRSAFEVEVGIDEFEEAFNEALFNLGGGLKVHVTRRAHLRGDLRYINGGDVDDNFWRAYGGLTVMLGE